MKIAIGTANFGDKYGINNSKLNSSEIKKLKKFLLGTNIKIFDTSQLYKDSEKTIGKLKLRNFKIVTKIKLQNHKKNSKEKFDDIILKSLSKLGINKIYGVLFHDYKDLLNKDGKKFLSYLIFLKKKKVIKNIGISIYDPKELDKIWKFWKPDIVQAPFNILDQRIHETGWLKILKKNNIKFFSRSCFLQGILINKNKKLYLSKSCEKRINEFYFWCKNKKISRVQACLHFVKQFKNIDYVILGFDNIKNLEFAISQFKKKKINIPKKFSIKNLKLIDPRNWKLKK